MLGSVNSTCRRVSTGSTSGRGGCGLVVVVVVVVVVVAVSGSSRFPHKKTRRTDLQARFLLFIFLY